MTAVEKGWHPLRCLPEVGETVRCVVFGDDYERDGPVTQVWQGYVFVDFVFKTERYTCDQLEIYKPRS